ncbi:hypothetical protein [Cohnella algarum]|uniref:hypothetical protein n=1 Tax=Cohnella algarum TaxID=2044859 RepID=UPI0019672D5F|nr:hypothetical protein [Cohnella algarum]MBN2980122.1 hypothetical protein [Cohnella algarum]
MSRFWDDDEKRWRYVRKSKPLPMTGNGGAVTIPDGSITTAKLADGSVTTAKLASGTKAPSAATADAAPWAGITGKPSTFPPTIGSTSLTAKAGNWTPAAADISDASVVGRSVLTAADAAAARTAIGAGTSSQNLTALTATEATAGTATTARAITAAVLAGAINERTKNKAEITALTPIADPNAAELSTVATLLNAVVAALKA